MKKIYTLSFILLASLSFGQAFTATYDFAGVVAATTGVPANGLSDPTPPPTVAGLTFGQFSAIISATSTAQAGSTGAGRFSYTNQPAGATTAVNTYSTLTGSLDPLIYFEVSVTPLAGTTFDLTQITFTSQKSGTGIRTYAVRSSIDGYSTNLPASINPANTELSVVTGNIFYRNLDGSNTAQNGSTITLGTGFTGITSKVTFRFYGWNSESSTGSFGIDNVAISGSTTILSLKNNSIAGLNMYPNPVKNGNFYITSDSSDAKTVAIYDILGKQVLNSKTLNNSVNVANLKSGTYIVRINEGAKTDTRKLIIE
jgi:hypothetical protein